MGDVRELQGGLTEDRVLSSDVVSHANAPAASDHLPVVVDLRWTDRGLRSRRGE
jgi:hypothetical protein